MVITVQKNIWISYGYYVKYWEQFILISVIITIIFINLCNISLCFWVREPHQTKIT